MTIEATMSRTKPDYRPFAEAMMNQILAIVNPDGTFTDPEYEREFQEWKAAREAQKGGS